MTKLKQSARTAKSRSSSRRAYLREDNRLGAKTADTVLSISNRT